MATRGLVNGRGPRSGRDLVFRCYPPELLLTPPKKKETEADLLGQPRFKMYVQKDYSAGKDAMLITLPCERSS